MVISYSQTKVKFMTEGALPTENWHLPSASAGTESMATAATEPQYLVREFRVEIRYEATYALIKTGRIGL